MTPKKTREIGRDARIDLANPEKEIERIITLFKRSINS